MRVRVALGRVPSPNNLLRSGRVQLCQHDFATGETRDRGIECQRRLALLVLVVDARRHDRLAEAKHIYVDVNVKQVDYPVQYCEACRSGQPSGEHATKRYLRPACVPSPSHPSWPLLTGAQTGQLPATSVRCTPEILGSAPVRRLSTTRRDNLAHQTPAADDRSRWFIDSDALPSAPPCLQYGLAQPSVQGRVPCLPALRPVCMKDRQEQPGAASS